jgi:K+ transporter
MGSTKILNTKRGIIIGCLTINYFGQIYLILKTQNLKFYSIEFLVDLSLNIHCLVII